MQHPLWDCKDDFEIYYNSSNIICYLCRKFIILPIWIDGIATEGLSNFVKSFLFCVIFYTHYMELSKQT